MIDQGITLFQYFHRKRRNRELLNLNSFLVMMLHEIVQETFEDALLPVTNIFATGLRTEQWDETSSLSGSTFY